MPFPASRIHMEKSNRLRCRNHHRESSASSTSFLSEDFLSAYQIPNGAPDVGAKAVPKDSMGVELARL